MFYHMASKKILIVEDELIIALMLEQMVAQMQHEVIGKVSTGEEAIDQALSMRPDIILMDINLQGEVDGIEAASTIQEKSNIPVIYITGNTNFMCKERLKNTDYIDFLAKPVTKDQLSDSFALVS
jgi:two-component SAPR family response regulator